jgi:DNA-binding NarL/FixJ family response regulator
VTRSTPISVLLVDDHPVLLEGLRLLVGSSEGLEVVATATTGAATVQAAERHAPHVVLLDLDLGVEDGLAVLPRIRAASPRSKVLVLTGVRDHERHETAVLAGARGLFTKDRSPELLVKAIHEVHEGELWFDRQLLDTSLQRAMSTNRESTRKQAMLASLTEREFQIVNLIAEGRRNGDIATSLGITPKTVRNHLSAIYDKLGVADRLELLAFAYENGLATSGA